ARTPPKKPARLRTPACPRLALGQNTTPAAIEDAIRQIDDFAVQTRVLEREAALGADHAERLAAIADTKQKVEGQLAELQARWEKERDLVTRIRDIRGKIEENSAAAASAGNGGSAPAPATSRVGDP